MLVCYILLNFYYSVVFVQLNSFFTRKFNVHFSCEVEAWAFIQVCCSEKAQNLYFRATEISQLDRQCCLCTARCLLGGSSPQCLEMLSLKKCWSCFFNEKETRV